MIRSGSEKASSNCGATFSLSTPANENSSSKTSVTASTGCTPCQRRTGGDPIRDGKNHPRPDARPAAVPRGLPRHRASARCKAPLSWRNGLYWWRVVWGNSDPYQRAASPPTTHRSRYRELTKLGVDFGKALQLVNILRDLPADLRQGRCLCAGGSTRSRRCRTRPTSHPPDIGPSCFQRMDQPRRSPSGFRTPLHPRNPSPRGCGSPAICRGTWARKRSNSFGVKPARNPCPPESFPQSSPRRPISAAAPA